MGCMHPPWVEFKHQMTSKRHHAISQRSRCANVISKTQRHRHTKVERGPGRLAVRHYVIRKTFVQHACVQILPYLRCITQRCRRGSSRHCTHLHSQSAHAATTPHEHASWQVIIFIFASAAALAFQCGRSIDYHPAKAVITAPMTPLTTSQLHACMRPAACNQ